MNFLTDKDGFTVRDFISIALTGLFLFISIFLTWMGYGLVIFGQIFNLFAMVLIFYFAKGNIGDYIKKIFTRGK